MAELKENVLSGWITINRSPQTRYADEWYYTGADVHETRDKAMKIAAPNRVAVCFIEVAIPDRKKI